MDRSITLALAMLLAGCGAAPTPATAPALEASVIGGGGSGTAVDFEGNEAVAADPTPAPTTSSEVAAAPSPAPSPTPSPSATPSSSGDSDDDDDDEVAPTPTPSPSATSTATPSPSPTPTPLPTATPESRTLTVDSKMHAVVYGPSSYLGGPLQVTAIDKAAFDNTSRQSPFRALAGIDRGRYGWSYKRVETLEDANSWSADVGNPGSVCFLDSADGMTDNSGTWMVHQHAGDIQDDQEIRASEHVTRWDPKAVASMDLGAERTWSVSLESVRIDDPFAGYPGVFLVFNHPDGGRDFRIVTGQAQTIRTRGYVYAFYLTDGTNTPDQADRLKFE